jgi:plasmid stability protein
VVSITIHNLPDDTHRALRLRAARKGRSLEAEILTILAEATKPEGGSKLSARLAFAIHDAGGLTDSEAESFSDLRDRTPAEPLRFA